MKSLRIGILGAGLGSRMQTMSKSKPLAKLGSRSLLELLLDSLQKINPAEVTCALRDELLNDLDKQNLPPEADYIFVNTESSLHTLRELVLKMGSDSPVLFTMADTIMKPADLSAFAHFCASLPKDSCAVLVTPFVDDEKPLWVQVDSQNFVTKFGSEPGPYVTSGMYFLSPEAMKNAQVCVEQGMEKMRNFLGDLVIKKVPIKTFVVSKTIDVDHPSDLQKAEQFLRSE